MRLAVVPPLWLAAGAAAALALAVALPLCLGWRPYTVLTGSMRPALDPGDIVVNEPIQPLQARSGDVVTFPDPSRGGKLVTHRVRRVTAGDRNAHFVTKGDANNAVERWMVPLDDRIGRVVYRVPKAGYVAAWVKKPGAVILLLTLPTLLLGIFHIVEIWRPRDEDE